MSNPKRIPVVDFGNAHEMFVDELSSVDELGSVTHLTFTQLARSIESPNPERRVTVRLIIPNAVRTMMARQLLAGGRHETALDDNGFEHLH
jgi:hypothetical protein